MPVARDERRIAQAPVGDLLEQRRIGVGILRHDVDRRMHGARLCEAETRRKAQIFRRLVDRHQHVDIAALAGDDAR